MTITNLIAANFQIDAFISNGMDDAKTCQEVQAVDDAASTLDHSSISLLKADGAYAHLTQKSETNRNTLVGANIRADLKKHFPGVRFSVRKGSAREIDIEWVEGPRSEAVEDIISKYQNGYFYGMEDRYVYQCTAFNDLFGGIEYVFPRRYTIAAHIEDAAKPSAARQRLALRMLPAAELYELISRNLEKFAVLKSIPGYVAFSTLVEGADTQTRLHLIEIFLTKTAASEPIAEVPLPSDLCGAITF